MSNNNFSNKPIVCVIGLGYVGFPLAVLCSAKGYEVFGYDVDAEKLKRVEQKENIVNESYLDKLLSNAKINVFQDARLMRIFDIFIICVPTPVNNQYLPDLSYVASAAQSIADSMKPGALVIVESTVNPGACEEIVRPIFEKSGFVAGESVFISHCPERINPGDPKWNIGNIPRIVGSLDKKGLEKTVSFYKSIIDAPILAMRTIKEAEAAKIVENAFRDINIAFANELAMSFDSIGIDVVNVIKGAATKPFSFMPHWPGCGVGGHCIPVDPYYLIHKATEHDFDHTFLKRAREINNGMVGYTIKIIQDALNKIGKPIQNTHIGIMGVSYKADMGDVRMSPAVKIAKFLKHKGALLHIFDPYLPQFSSVNRTSDLLDRSEILVLTTDHKEFKKIPGSEFKERGIQAIVDGRNCLNKEEIEQLGIIYKGIGR